MEQCVGGNKKEKKKKVTLVLCVTEPGKLGGGGGVIVKKAAGEGVRESNATEQTCADIAGVWLSPGKMMLGQGGGARM